MSWIWPINTKIKLFPDVPGQFGTKRKFDFHTGVDFYCNIGTFYCNIGTKVFAVEDGNLIKVEEFTGPNVGTPWWNSTYAMLVEGDSGVIVYGELYP